MAQKLNSFHANLFAVLAKERELQNVGYIQVDINDQYHLKCGEYCVQVPNADSTEALQGWESLTIFWRTVSGNQ